MKSFITEFKRKQLVLLAILELLSTCSILLIILCLEGMIDIKIINPVLIFLSSNLVIYLTINNSKKTNTIY